MNDQSIRQTLRAGAFFIVAIVLFAAAALWVAGSEWVRGPTIAYEVDLNDAGELAVGDEVYVAGVAVGKVAGIGVNLGSPTPVTVTIEVPESMTLREDSAAKVVMLDLLGGMALAIDPGSASSAPLTAGDHISGVAADGPQELLTRSGEVFTQVTALLKQTKRILAGISAQIPTTVDRIAELSTSAASVARRMQRLTAEMEQTVPRVLDRADRATVQTVSIMARVEGAMTSIESFTAKLDSALGEDGERARAIITQAQTTLTTTDAAAASIADNRATIDETLASLAQAAASLQAFSQQISEQPYSLIRVLPTEDRTPGEPMGAPAP